MILAIVSLTGSTVGRGQTFDLYEVDGKLRPEGRVELHPLETR